MLRYIFISSVVIHLSASVIYNLDDVDYDRMPPVFSFDKYETCLKQGGTYCVAKIEVSAEPSNDLIGIITEYSAHYHKHFNHSVIDRGICLSKTCHDYYKSDYVDNSEEIQNVVTTCVNDSIWREYGLQIKSSHLLSCEKSTNVTETDIYDWIVMLIFVAILLVNTVGTSYDVLLRMTKDYNKSYGGSENKFLLSFSTIKNFKSLINPKYDLRGSEHLQSFNVVKVIISTGVVLAHTMILFLFFIDNPHDLEKTYDQTHYHIIFNGLAVIYIFFVMSGFLLAFKLQEKEETQQLTWSQVPQLIIHRWIRLSAPYTIVLLFSATWLRHLGSGPLWNLFVTRGVSADCRKYWWLHLLYLQNYNSNDKLCIFTTWQIAADTQLFIIGVIAYVATTSSQTRGLVLMMLMVVGMVGPAIQTWLQNMDPIVIPYPEFFRAKPSDVFWLMHIRGHNNLTCYSIGMATGYLLYNRQKLQKAFTNYKVASWLARFVVWAGIPVILATLHSSRMFFEGERASVGVRVIYAVGHRFLLGGLVAFGIISVANVAMGSYFSFFRWRGWVICSQLSYCVSLLHMTVVNIIIGSRTQLEHFSMLNLAIHFVGVLFLSYLLALSVFLLVEAPTKRLLEYYTKTHKHKKENKN